MLMLNCRVNETIVFVNSKGKVISEVRVVRIAGESIWLEFTLDKTVQIIHKEPLTGSQERDLQDVHQEAEVDRGDSSGSRHK